MISRHLLEKYFAEDPRLIAEFEDQANAVASNAESIAATETIKDATVLTLSPNAEFTNERVLELAPGLAFELADGVFRLKLDSSVIITDGVQTLIGKVLSVPMIVDIENCANDAAAAAVGVPVGGIYHNAGALRVRLV